MGIRKIKIRGAKINVNASVWIENSRVKTGKKAEVERNETIKEEKWVKRHEQTHKKIELTYSSC